MKTCFLILMTAAAALAASPAKIVMVAGTPSHAPAEHEFNAGTLLLEKCLRQNKGVETVFVKGGWPEDEKVFDGASAIVLYMDGGAKHPLIMGDRLETMSRLMKKGVGLVCLHYAVEVPKEKGGARVARLDWRFLRTPVLAESDQRCARRPSCPETSDFARLEEFAGKEKWYHLIRFFPMKARHSDPDHNAAKGRSEQRNHRLGCGGARRQRPRIRLHGAHFHSNWGIPDFRRMIGGRDPLERKGDVPAGGAERDVTAADLQANLDPKPPESSSRWTPPHAGSRARVVHEQYERTSR